MMMNRLRAIGILASSTAFVPVVARAQGSPYKIGVTYPLTGPIAAVANEQFEGGKLAVDEINKAGGVKGHPLQLIVEDSLGTAPGGVAAMRKLVQVDGVPAILTSYTNVANAQIPLADELHVTTLSNVQTPDLFLHAKYSFSHAATWPQTVPLMTAYWKAHKVERIYGLLTNAPIGHLQSERLHAGVAQTGGSYEESLLDPDATDFRGTIARAQSWNPQVLVITGQGTSTEIVAVKQVREMGLRAQIWSIGNSYSGSYFRLGIGPYAEGMVFGGRNLDPNAPASNAFARAYSARVGDIPGYQAGEVYDMIKMFAYAIVKGGYSSEGVRDAIATLKGGVRSVLGGEIVMGPDHFTVASNTALWRVSAGKLARLT
jgi:branched-chain amino acid transport system substrate-binding protein